MKYFEEMEPELLMRSLIFLYKWDRTYTSYDVAFHSILFHLLKTDPLMLFHENDDGKVHKRKRV